jgi:NAD+ kinase
MTRLERIGSLGLCGNPHKEGLLPAMTAIREICAAGGVQARWSRDLAQVLGDPASGVEDAELVTTCDAIVALGGDGTMLRAARMIGTSGVPLLGINLGSLGYLTDVPVADLPEAMRRMLAGEYHLESRTRVQCTVWRGSTIVAEEAGLNDVAVNMGPLPRTILLELRVDGVSLGRFLGDGIIFATATGSTAYNLSAGGAICEPQLPTLLVTPICPHSLGMRPLILGSDASLEVVLHEVGNGATMTTDGQVPTPLQRGDRLRCHVTAPVVNLVKFPNSNFFRVLRHKLNWGAHPRVRWNGRRGEPGPVAAGEPV